MPGTSDDALRIEISRPQRRAHVGAQIVDRQVFPLVIEHRDQAIAYLKGRAFAFRNRTDFRDGDKLVRVGIVGHIDQLRITFQHRDPPYGHCRSMCRIGKLSCAAQVPLNPRIARLRSIRVSDAPAPLSINDFQRLIRDMYLEKDIARGVDGTFMWLMEEVGELAAALREGTHEEQAAEFADVLAWLTTIANVVGVDLAEALRDKYGAGCPGCGQLVCTCDAAGKP